MNCGKRAKIELVDSLAIINQIRNQSRAPKLWMKWQLLDSPLLGWTYYDKALYHNKLQDINYKKISCLGK